MRGEWDARAPEGPRRWHSRVVFWWWKRGSGSRDYSSRVTARERERIWGPKMDMQQCKRGSVRLRALQEKPSLCIWKGLD